MISMSIKNILRSGKANVRNDLSDLLHVSESQPSHLYMERIL